MESKDRRPPTDDMPDIMEDPTVDTGEPLVNDSASVHPDGEPITPQRPGSMPRAEDDDEVREKSPEFHDRPNPAKPDPPR